jgi:hypothetical protein
MKKIFLAAALMLCASFAANATLITNSQNINSVGQDFSFALPVFAGTNGVLTVDFSGDFNEDTKNEFLIMSFAGLAGSATMAESGVTNTIAGIMQTGLTAQRIYKLMDSTVSVTFSLTDSFLASLSGNSIMFDATGGVEDWFNRGVSGTDADFVSFSLSYDVAQANTINAPASIAMFLCGIIFVSAYRRKS